MRRSFMCAALAVCFVGIGTARAQVGSPAPAATPAPAAAPGASAPAPAAGAPAAAAPAPAPAPVSRLASLDRPSLVAIAIDELTGKNNGPRTLPGKTAPSIVVGLTAVDQEFLARQVFGPYLWDADKRQPLEKAACQRYLRRAQITWTRTIGEALSEGVCNIKLDAVDLFTNPAVKLALADELLLGHPRRDELLKGVRMAISATASSVAHQVCYGLNPSDAAVLDDPKCKLQWADATPDQHLRVAAFYFEPRPLEQWSLEDITDGWSALTGMTTKQANKRMQELKGAFTARVALRNASVIARRKSAPVALVTVEEAANSLDKSSTYLWHAKCGDPTKKMVQNEMGAVEADSVCITVAYAKPSKDGCFEDSYNFVKMPNGAVYTKFDVVAPTQQIECP